MPLYDQGLMVIFTWRNTNSLTHTHKNSVNDLSFLQYCITLILFYTSQYISSSIWFLLVHVEFDKSFVLLYSIFNVDIKLLTESSVVTSHPCSSHKSSQVKSKVLESRVKSSPLVFCSSSQVKSCNGSRQVKSFFPSSHLKSVWCSVFPFSIQFNDSLFAYKAHFVN